MAALKKAKRRAAAKKQPAKKQPSSEQPLPPPVPVESVTEQPKQEDPFGLGAILNNSSPESAAAFAASSETSSVSEPRPGEPLSEEAERLVNDVPESIGGVYVAGEKLDSEEAAAAVGALAGMSPEFLENLISFNEDDVRGVLEEGFDFLAERFDSEHWKLTERQSRMLGGPTTQLLSGIWSKLAQMLPAQLAQWCMSMPGLAGFVVVSSIVVGPKVAQQWSITRKRKSLGSEPRRPGPTPVAFRAHTGPVGPIDTNAVQPIPTDHVNE